MQGPRFEPGTSWWEAQMLPLRYAIPLGKQTLNNIVLANCLRPLAFQYESNIKQKFKLRYSWKKYLIWKVFSFCLVSSNWDLWSFLFFRNRGNLEGELFSAFKKDVWIFTLWQERGSGRGGAAWLGEIHYQLNGQCNQLIEIVAFTHQGIVSYTMQKLPGMDC